jgi:hypothetical protein
MRGTQIRMTNSIPREGLLTWGAIALCGFFTLACIAAGQGRVLSLGFPVVSLLTGMVLFWRDPALYVGFQWWMWILAPLVRRFADFHSDFTDPSPILLAPYLITLLTLVTLLRQLPKQMMQQRGLAGLGFAIATVALAYGLCIGLIRKESPVTVGISLLDWLAPLSLGYYLLSHWREYPAFRRVMRRTFLVAVLVMGAYGIFQFLVAPDWDRLWLRNVILTGNTSFGLPEPLKMRVWGTLHGPGIFGATMMVGLLLLLNQVGPLTLPAMGVGYLAFLLSLVRSAWLGWIVGFLSVAVTLKPKFQMRLMAIAAVALLCLVPLVTMEPFSELIATRVQTLADGGNDFSAQERQGNYDRWLAYAAANVLGDGLGAIMDPAGGKAVLDSAYLDLLVSLGWFGALAYLLGLALALGQFLKTPLDRNDDFAISARAIVFAMLFQSILGYVFIEMMGLLLWGFLGIGLAAQRYAALSSRPIS